MSEQTLSRQSWGKSLVAAFRAAPVSIAIKWPWQGRCRRCLCCAASSSVSSRVSAGALKRGSRIFAEHAALTIGNCRGSEGAGRPSVIFCLAVSWLRQTRESRIRGQFRPRLLDEELSCHFFDSKGSIGIVIPLPDVFERKK